MINKEKIAEGVKLILEAIGEDPNREGLVETPDRIARMYEEIFAGIGKTAEDHLAKTFEINRNDLVLERDITFFSMCEHHLVPFYGKAHIAYIPNGRVAGLSKLARTVETYAKKPQLQEQLTSEVADAMMEYLGAQGVMVVIEAEHMCMTMRGVKKPGARTLTTTYRGVFEENYELRKEVLSLINQ
ncbi:GTP cyclohydrolase I FolE [Clostridium paraputrificum]|uniref:GTP cyclohydrolase I FolE n=1 Tax=Clostridium TaxID=1485 RepID=UPI003D353840